MGVWALVDHRTSVRSNFCSKREVTMAALTATPPNPIRLTRRGRLVVLVLLLAIATAVTALAAGPTLAADPPGPRPTAVVQPDDTLWSIAGRVDVRHDRFL